MSDPRYLNGTAEQMMLELAFRHYFYHGGEKEMWFEEEAREEGERDPAAPVQDDEEPVIDLRTYEPTPEEREEAMKNLMALLPGGSITSSGEWIAEPDDDEEDE